MNVELNDRGNLDILDVSPEQVKLLAQALKDQAETWFADDDELRRLYKLLAVMQSEVFEDLKTGRIDLKQFRRQ